MKFYIGSETSSGLEFDTKEEFLERLSSLIDTAEKRGIDCFDITLDPETAYAVLFNE